MWGSNLTKIPKWFKAPKLRSIEIEQTHITNIEQFAFNHLQALEYLIIKYDNGTRFQ